MPFPQASILPPFFTTRFLSLAYRIKSKHCVAHEALQTWAQANRISRLTCLGPSRALWIAVLLYQQEWPASFLPFG